MGAGTGIAETTKGGWVCRAGGWLKEDGRESGEIFVPEYGGWDEG